MNKKVIDAGKNYRNLEKYMQNIMLMGTCIIGHLNEK